MNFLLIRNNYGSHVRQAYAMEIVATFSTSYAEARNRWRTKYSLVATRNFERNVASYVNFERSLSRCFIRWSARAMRSRDLRANDEYHQLFTDCWVGGIEYCVFPVLQHTLPYPADYGLFDTQYKYLMDVDGNGWSGRFHRLMSTKSLVFKSTIFPEWYADRIEPWYQYVLLFNSCASLLLIAMQRTPSQLYPSQN